ncbi:type VII secretion-associated serine protease mycosin [Streptomyces sp. CAU 1734]|uniref:type VII secretion-associated serine protease mycosin n=1 Tax=Streptomyces sp. CAU 1734 TaxID=3140360 RepID=UPI0032602963
MTRVRTAGPAGPAGPRARRGAGIALLAAAFAVLPAAPAQADGIRPRQWGLEALNTAEAWRTTKGSGITVAVLDTGVDDQHPDLTGNVLPGKDFIGFGASRGDGAWARHGTAMAGIIAAHGHGEGAGEGVMGIAPEAKILPVRVILESTDKARDRARNTRGPALAEAIRWAADQGADVINLSLGDDSESARAERGEDAAVQYALGKGAVLVASAGNGGEKGDRVSYPAAYPGVIAVTAVDQFGTRASFSTRRWYATVNAPGVNVVMPDPDRKYYQGWGTSAAAAFVSGAVALVRAAHPGLTPAQVKKVLMETAGDRPEGGRNDAKGYGMVDPAAAIEAAGKLRPADARATAPGYAKKYFGPGPRRETAGSGNAEWLTILAGSLGALLLLAAVALWRTGTARDPGH